MCLRACWESQVQKGRSVLPDPQSVSACLHKLGFVQRILLFVLEAVSYRQDLSC